MRCLYVDLDGTLLGPDASLLTGADGRFSLLGVRALEACARAGAEVVIYSGRKQSSVFEGARLIGCSSYVFELGAGLVLDGELEWLTDGIVPSAQHGTIYEQIERSGGPALLLDRFREELEYHTPWSAQRNVSHLFRGRVDLEEANAALRDGGLDWLRLVDNGIVRAAGERPVATPKPAKAAPDSGGASPPAGGDEPTAGPPGLAKARAAASLPAVHAYHLLPAGASKARAVARHMQARGYRPQECVAVGDSREDLDTAAAVGAFWLVANALARDPTLEAEVARRPGVRLAAESYGAGVYEAVVTTLAERG